jgi:hypothetical protein
MMITSRAARAANEEAFILPTFITTTPPWINGITVNGPDIEPFVSPTRVDETWATATAKLRVQQDRKWKISKSIRTKQIQATQISTSTPSINMNSDDPNFRSKCVFPCQRAFIVVHKMGYMQAEAMAAKVFPKENVINREIVNLPGFVASFNKMFKTPTSDYRHVLITRNLEEAVLSGYFYHRTGRECWLNWNGEKGKNGTMFPGWLLRQKTWEYRLTFKNKNLFPIPPSKGRDLCRYLMDEPPRIGFRAYLEWTYSMHLAPLWEFYQFRQQSEGGKFQKTMHVCYDDILNNYDESVTSFTKHFSLDESKNRTHGYSMETRQASAANHGTEKNQTLKEELRSLYNELDDTLFDGRLRQWNDALGC